MFENCYASPSPFYYFRWSNKKVMTKERRRGSYITTLSLDAKAALEGSHAITLDHFCGFKIDSITLQLRHEEGDTDL